MVQKSRKKKILKIVVIIAIALGVPLFGITTYYSLKYMNWYAKSSGYPDLYYQKDIYPFVPVTQDLANNIRWKQIVSDESGDGNIRTWSDAKSLEILVDPDTVWFRNQLHNYININEPMVSIAFDLDNDLSNGTDWYGSVKEFSYDLIIGAGFFRDGSQYKGYNFLGDEIGSCTPGYNLPEDYYFLGVPRSKLESFQGKRFVASVGDKGLWNDDIGTEMQIFTLKEN